MKSRVLLACAIAVAGLGGVPQVSGAATRAAAPRTRDWTQVVNPTAAGGFVMGNPNATVKLVEFGSMTCPHCRAFDADGVPTLVNQYVKSGKVSWEFRNYVRDAFDITAALITRCQGPRAFFPLTRALFQDQSNWIAKVQAAPEDQLKSLGDVPMNRRFVEMAKLSGLQQLAQAHGLPVARSSQCLSNTKSVNQLAEMDKRAMADFPDFAGTPTFLLNGKMLEKTANWEALEPQLKAALGQRG